MDGVLLFGDCLIGVVALDGEDILGDLLFRAEDLLFGEDGEDAKVSAMTAPDDTFCADPEAEVLLVGVVDLANGELESRVAETSKISRITVCFKPKLFRITARGELSDKLRLAGVAPFLRGEFGGSLLSKSSGLK